MVDWKLWRFIFLTSILEIVIIIIVAAVLGTVFPQYLFYIVLGAIIAAIVYVWISYYIYKPVVKHQRVEPQDELIGKLGVAITDLTPRGQVKIRTRAWSARCTSKSVAAGTKVKVIQMDGIQLIVEEIN